LWITRLGVSLDDLDVYVKVVGKISSEKDVKTEGFVD